jgi:hypothetical protein
MEIKRISPVCTEVRIDRGPDFKWELLVTSDHHFDSKHCDRRMLWRHHDQALEKGAGIICIGDQLDVMQGKRDRRGTKSSIRPEHNVIDYYDAVVDDAIDKYGKYKDNYLFISPGNHETAITKHQETNVHKRICAGLGVEAMPYRGWLKLVFHQNGGMVRTRWIYYTHGAGGGGEVTKGVIRAQRRAVYIDAHVCLQGHIHESWHVAFEKAGMNANGKPYLWTQDHFSSPGYKEEYLEHDGFHAEMDRAPKPRGAWWLKFYFQDKDIKMSFEKAV